MVSPAQTRGDEALALILRAELIERLGAVLQAPEVLKACIGAAHDVGCHDVGGDGEVETTEAAGHCHAHQAGLAAGGQILLGAGSVGDTAVGHCRTVVVHVGGVVGDGGAAKLAHNLEHAVVVVHGVVVVERRVVKLLRIGEVALFQSHDLAHQGMLEVKFKIGIVSIEISHGCAYLEFFL